MSERYIVEEGSLSGHVDFNFTVFDTESGFYLCESSARSDAQKIADALNGVKADEN